MKRTTKIIIVLAFIIFAPIPINYDEIKECNINFQELDYGCNKKVKWVFLYEFVGDKLGFVPVW